MSAVEWVYLGYFFGAIVCFVVGACIGLISIQSESDPIDDWHDRLGCEKPDENLHRQYREAHSANLIFLVIGISFFFGLLCSPSVKPPLSSGGYKRDALGFLPQI